MINDSNFYTKIFRTSPGKFTKREVLLIRHFLLQTKGMDTPLGINKLWKAINLAPNNVKWILKTFLVTNVQKKRAKSLNQVISTVNGKVYQKNKIILKVEKGKAALTPTRKRYRFPMFPDRVGEGAKFIYQAEVLGQKRVPKANFDNIVKRNNIKAQQTLQKQVSNTERSVELSVVKAEMDVFAKFLKKIIVFIDPIGSMIENIRDFNELVHPNASSLDKVMSGIWFQGIYTTARNDGHKLIEEFIKYNDSGDTIIDLKRYEFTDMGDRWFTKLNGKAIDSAPYKKVQWVFRMFKPVSGDLLKALNGIKSKKIKNVDPIAVAEAIAEIEKYKVELHSFWNCTFDAGVHDAESGVNEGTEGRDKAKPLLEKGEHIIAILKDIRTKVLNARGSNRIKPVTNKDLLDPHEDQEVLTDIDLEKIEKETKEE